LFGFRAAAADALPTTMTDEKKGLEGRVLKRIFIATKYELFT